jgi:hypothetical protein
MVRLVEVEVPQAIGVLGKVLRHLEEYQAVRARDPQAAYDGASFARELWPEEATSDEAASEDSSVPLAPPAQSGTSPTESIREPATNTSTGRASGTNITCTGKASGKHGKSIED